jgi:predicted HicB family RNase H-like nuclease
VPLPRRTLQKLPRKTGKLGLDKTGEIWYNMYSQLDMGAKMEVKLMVRMPRELRKAAKIKATQENTNVSAVVRRLLEQWLKEPEQDKPPPN